MPDDKSNVGEPDRSRVAADQDYEVGYLAGKYSDSGYREVTPSAEPCGKRRSWLNRTAMIEA